MGDYTSIVTSARNPLVSTVTSLGTRSSEEPFGRCRSTGRIGVRSPKRFRARSLLLRLQQVRHPNRVTPM